MDVYVRSLVAICNTRAGGQGGWRAVTSAGGSCGKLWEAVAAAEASVPPATSSPAARTTRNRGSKHSPQHFLRLVRNTDQTY